MTTKKDNPAEAPADRMLILTRVFDAPRELVWEAWTKPEHVARWWGPRGFTTTIEEMDVRPGGVWKHVMHGPDGADYPNRSVFTEVVKPERIVFAHGGNREGGPSVQFESTWTFDALDDGQTRVTIRMVFPSAEDRDRVVWEFGAIEGGKQTLARLGEQLAQTPVIIERTFPDPVETVWRALTDLEQMKRWYFPHLTSFQPEVGFETRFTVRKDDNDFVHLWKVTDVVPGKKLACSWKYDGYPGDSLLTFELLPEGAGTRLKLTHSGLETFLPETHPNLARGNFVKGWSQIMGSSLKAFLEK